MALTYTSIKGTSKSYKTALIVLAVLAIAGLACFALSYLEGHQLFGNSNAVPWGMPIVLAIYLIGLSAGSLILSSLTYVLGKEEYKPIARIAVFLAIVLIFGAMLSIAVDLGRPEKFWRLFTMGWLSNMTSMFAINAILYGGYFVISLLYLGFIFSGKARATRTLGIIAVGWAMLVHTGTGAIFGFIAARETWVSPVKPFEFLAAALTSGMALLLLVAVITLKLGGRKMKRETVSGLAGMLSVFIIVLVLLIIIDKLTHYYAPARAATAYMLSGPYAWIFWDFQIGLGVALPLAILLRPSLKKATGWVMAASLSVVIGVFFERYYLVIPGAAYPLNLYPGRIEGVWGDIGAFQVTPVETILSIGILAILAVVFMLGLKYLELLPAGGRGDEEGKEGQVNSDNKNLI